MIIKAPRCKRKSFVGIFLKIKTPNFFEFLLSLVDIELKLDVVIKKRKRILEYSFISLVKQTKYK